MQKEMIPTMFQFYQMAGDRGWSVNSLVRVKVEKVGTSFGKEKDQTTFFFQSCLENRHILDQLSLKLWNVKISQLC